ncbi:MAG: DUF3616 domain-containing protein [Pseudomonadota bacterium]|nr:DUF3616 domain-containing protein [Pseudomonadota bacterium]
MVGALLALLACTCAGSASPVPGGVGTLPSAAPVSATADGGVLAGACEASTIIPWNGGWLVGDNEDSKQLYAYDLDFKARGTVALPTEVDDIESLALRGAGYTVVGSHSTNKDGKARPQRERLLTPEGVLAPLVLDACPTCVAARGLGPDQSGLNIEGAASWGDRLWLGLRAPLSASGKALLLGLDAGGAVAETVEIDLGGLGVREMIPYGDGLLLIAGPTADASAPHQLYKLDAARVLTPLPVRLPTSTEGIAVDPTTPGTLVYVTDGDGKPGKCKQPATWGRVSIGG